uniref:Reverse transcriptase/retrotransposon-derived protein RNase H-like domain-containing protein n=1 Tax=Oryzias latipes TaxID=8090 RepID=A0A3P9IWF8_ORYLA
MTQTTHDLQLQSFKQNKVSFYGHTLTEDGLLPSEDKLQAIKDIQAPTSTNELQTLLGMVTYLNRFSTKLAEWEHHHQQALDDIKKELCTKQLISYYDPDPNTVTILQCDASTLEKIVGMASRCLSPTESRYSNIEKGENKGCSGSLHPNVSLSSSFYRKARSTDNNLILSRQKVQNHFG